MDPEKKDLGKNFGMKSWIIENKEISFLTSTIYQTMGKEDSYSDSFAAVYERQLNPCIDDL